MALPGDTGPLPPPLSQPKSRWTPVRWAELPGFTEDALHEAWNAWIKSCERPVAPFTALCSEVRQLSIASGEEQRAWMMARLQPYRVESHSRAHCKVFYKGQFDYCCWQSAQLRLH